MNGQTCECGVPAKIMLNDFPCGELTRNQRKAQRRARRGKR